MKFNNNRIKVFLTNTLVLILMLGCNDDLLEQTNPNQLTTDSFWQTAEDAELGLIGAYSPLSVVTSYGRMANLMTSYRSDAIRPFDFSCCYNVANFKNTPNDSRMREVWRSWWKVIFRANQILENVPNIEMDQAQKDRILGQAYFLRAFVGFNLMNIWENIPFTTTSAKEIEDFFQTQIGPDEIRPILISDLEQAKNLLPASWPESDLGRATSGAAATLLGKVYLYNQQWSEAEAQFSEVIGGQHASYDLVTDYASLFTSEDGDNSVESVFEIQLASNNTQIWGEDAANVDRAAIFQMDFSPPGFTNQPSAIVNQWAFDLFMSEQTNGGETDPRAFATMTWNYPGAMVFEKTWAEAVPIIALAIGNNSGESYDEDNLITVRKYLLFGEGFEGGVTPTRSYNGINWKAIRFADVLLMYAEAQNELNNTTEALQALNRIRARADMPAITTTDQAELRAAIRKERILELSFEGDRFQDLKRWGIITDRFTPGDTNDLRTDAAQDFVPGKHERLPIWQNDIDTNPNLVQNPGY